ncbi:MAG: MAPEG family protein [Polyangia bacterium]
MQYLNGLHALILYALVPLALTVGYVIHRVCEAGIHGVPINAWGRVAPRAVPPIFTRMQHAQLNVLESLPVFAVLVFAAHFEARAAVVDVVAPYILLARLAQTTTHLLGTGPRLVFIRGAFWFVQAALFVYLAVKLLG